ncbi:hypothetical protein K2173_021305 [Erythroxylum novogranatense]|uniref:Phosphatidic acid phosphatase type 2/haloperoxidase domain-containing protein n=1 Tax=Erythroxylum novogranatense TaxID=1862640 RepID=A0AAV8TY91_9ROSI|nr:hypothetical protein K2173_021305 [Erythroxylum novogranatense]
MLVSTAVFHSPTLKFRLSRSSKRDKERPSLNIRFPASKSTSSGGFGSKKAALLSHTMTELVKVSAFSDRDSEENVGFFQHEAAVNGITQFRSQLMALGLEATLNRLTKWLVAAIFGAIVIWRHDAEALWAAMGSVLNSILSVILKRILNQDRPFPISRSDPGMPSSHAQSIFYIVIFVILSTVQCLGVNELTLVLSALTFAFGSYLAWLRVSQQLHTIRQVFVGAAVGSCFSILWLWLWNDFVLKAFISSLWVRIIVVTGAVGFCLGFLVYVIRYWLNDD